MLYYSNKQTNKSTTFVHVSNNNTALPKHLKSFQLIPTTKIQTQIIEKKNHRQSFTETMNNFNSNTIVVTNDNILQPAKKEEPKG